MALVEVQIEDRKEVKPARTLADGSLKELKTLPSIVVNTPPVAAIFAVPKMEMRTGAI
jgi:hypothetical protein